MLRFASLAVLLAAAALPSRARACMPGCSGYHLTFTGPTGAGTTADTSVTVTWQDTIDGPTATFDLLVSDTPVPVYPMHSFPSELPGEVLAMGLSATSQSSWTWETSQRAAGTYFIYAVFHNPPFNTLVMPFAAVAVAHGTAVATSAALIRSPRGVNAVEGQVTIDLDAVASTSISPGATGATVDLYVGSPPDASNGTLVASVPAGLGQTLTWDSTGVPNGSYVFQAVLHDPSGVLATAYSPGEVQVGVPAQSSCATGGGSASVLALLGLLALSRRKVSRQGQLDQQAQVAE